MEFRKHYYSSPDHSTITMEIDYPGLGWQPFTASSNDAEGLSPILYAAAVEAGNVGPYAPPPPLSDDERRAAMPNVSARQLRLTLVRNGLSLALVTQTIASLPDGQQKDEAEIEWEYAHEFQRVSPTLNSIAAALGITSEQVDVMWSQALTA